MIELIGMLDSPFVRRVAISMKLMQIPFKHRPLSVFRNFDEFAGINPVVKAPTLVADDGTVLMDSQIILEYLERLAPDTRRLTPEEPGPFLRHQAIMGTALSATEKTVQIVYETNLRPAEKQHAPWLERVEGQLAAAYRRLDAQLVGVEGWLFASRPMQADVTAAVAWRFTQELVPDIAARLPVPHLRALSQRAEGLPEFQSTPLF